jgi:NADH-quinone oxidoreductase subunit F
VGPDAIIQAVADSGLRGRGGAGFPAGRKWQTVAENRASSATPSTVVVNAAEGEPGTFKDRALLRRNPYRLLEGALIAALAVGADAVVLALKASFKRELDRLRPAIAEVRDAGWTDGIDLAVVEGPSEYLYGEETALLEVVAGRNPFPRIAPPFRHGVDESDASTKSAAQVDMASAAEGPVTPPTLVNNAETLSNVPGILREGPDWFRSEGTDKSPGTVLCTISGSVRRHGVVEVAMGTPLRQVIELVGAKPRKGRRLTAAMSGVANPLVPESLFDTPVTYEDMQEIGSGLGAAGFIIFDDGDDPVAVAEGVSRFLAVESCGQCTPCKQDGLALQLLLDALRASRATGEEVATVQDHLATVADNARCFLAYQHQRVVGSVLQLFPDAFRAHASGQAASAQPVLIAPIVDLDGDQAVLDERHREKNPDWTFGGTDSGQAPADRLSRPS